MSKLISRKLFLSVLGLLGTAGILSAAALSTNYASVFLENLKIGGSYNLTQSANYPMWVSWKGEGRVKVRIVPTAPRSDELREGYEPIPDVSWVTFSKNDLELLPDETEYLDVILNIPADQKYLGKKYQCYLFVSSIPDTTGPGGGLAISLGLKGKLYFSTDRKPPTLQELRQLKQQEARIRQGVIVQPEKFMFEVLEFSTGSAQIEITEFEPLKIINSSPQKVQVSIEIINPEDFGINVPRDYQKGLLGELKLNKQRFSLKPDGVENLKIFWSGHEPKARKFYALRIYLKSPTLEIVKFVRIYLN